jgi:hypothetical protein
VAVRTSRRPSATLPAVALLAGALVLAGCTQADAPKASGGGSSSAGTSTSARASSSPASSPASPTATAKVEPSLGGRCEELLPVSVVNIALRRVIVGRTSFILGVAEPQIGRLAYLNCRYGLSVPVKGKPAPVPQVEIGLSLYSSPAQASRRLQATIENYLAHGAADKGVRVGQVSGTVLTGYGLPTLVAATGPRTVAVTVSPKLVARGSTAELASLAKAALDATAHYVGAGPAVTASPSSTG